MLYLNIFATYFKTIYLLYFQNTLNRFLKRQRKTVNYITIQQAKNQTSKIWKFKNAFFIEFVQETIQSDRKNNLLIKGFKNNNFQVENDIFSQVHIMALGTVPDPYSVV